MGDVWRLWPDQVREYERYLRARGLAVGGWRHPCGGWVYSAVRVGAQEAV